MLFRYQALTSAIIYCTLSVASLGESSLGRVTYDAFIQFKSIPNDSALVLTDHATSEAMGSFAQLLETTQGPPVGYKAALTNPRAQEKFKLTTPLLGRIYKNMILPSGSEISPEEGVRLMIEGDLVVRVGSASINKAKTHTDALAALDAIMPFVEVPDMMYDASTKLSANHLRLINCGARYGILGEDIKLDESYATLDRLSRIRITLQDKNDQVIASGDSSSLLGHPLNVVLWIVHELNQRGQALKPGELLSLGSITPLIPAKPGQAITATYVNLSPTNEVSVTFTIGERP